jgi:hypothetical protein
MLLAVTAASFWRYGGRLRIGCLSRVARVLDDEGVEGLLASDLLGVEPKDPASPVDDADDAVDGPDLPLLNSWPQRCLQGIQAGEFDVAQVVYAVDETLRQCLSLVTTRWAVPRLANPTARATWSYVFPCRTNSTALQALMEASACLTGIWVLHRCHVHHRRGVQRSSGDAGGPVMLPARPASAKCRRQRSLPACSHNAAGRGPARTRDQAGND